MVATRHGTANRSRHWQWVAVVAAVLLMPLASCAQAGDGAPSGWDPFTTATPTEAVEPSAAPATPVSASEVWADFYGVADPPDVPVVMKVMPEESRRYQDDCLREAGFTVPALGVLEIPPRVIDEAALAQYTCAMQVGVIPRYAQEWGRDQKHIQYTWTILDVVPCLEAQGHPISGVPSQMEFVGSYDTNPFYPFAQVTLEPLPPERENEEWARLEAECPQIAPSFVLWDGMSPEEWRATH